MSTSPAPEVDPAAAEQPMPVPALPPGFRLGVVTAAAQVEGAAAVDGRGPSVWDTFAARSGGVLGCDHYHRTAEDVALLQRLGVHAYRFSISWSRVQPRGQGPANAAGMDFYDRLVDGLLAHDIEPMATLHHWDLPQALEDDGGWLARSTADRFAEYAALVADRLADRVGHWVPVNEPNVAALFGYGLGRHAPGRRLGFEALVAAHHLLLAHGRGVVELRRAGAGSVGCSNNHAPIWPASDDDADVGAAKLVDTLWNGMFLEPMLLGRYPDDLEAALAEVVRPGDLATVRQPLDFYGVSYDGPVRIGASHADAEFPFQLCEVVGRPTADDGAAVVPEALREWLIVFRARYRAALPPIVVTGSGCADGTGPGPDGGVDDTARVAYLAGHLRAVQEAVQRGVDVRGFYVRSLLDGFEWDAGHSQRFGLVHVDPATGERTPKRSFGWYADAIGAQPRHR